MVEMQELTELHAHLGASTSPELLWSICHDRGIKLKAHDFWSFKNLVTVQPGEVKNLKQYDEFFHITEMIQSSPHAVERSVYEMAGGAYRRNLITRLEIRYNPMKRNQGGERDLDRIILASIHGMDKAMLEYPIKCGLIFCIDRSFTREQNKVIIEKAVKYGKHRGIIGIDVAGPLKNGFNLLDYAEEIKKAQNAGLGFTCHGGEFDDHEIEAAIELSATRLGHGVRCARNPDFLKLLQDYDITLEICPTSNLNIGVFSRPAELKKAIDVFLKAGVKMTVNTDGPELLQTTLKQERAFLLKNKILNQKQLDDCEENARKASFL
ncbi:MAG: adenosine deaminase [Candidatus Micrarchaeota archaeon]